MFQRPFILGIVNITPDSFSDGGKYFAADAAIAHARKLAAEGADVIDLGPASSNPDAAPVPPEEEIRRLGPVLEALAADGIAVSVDSFRPETQAHALAHGAQYLNDIHGFDTPHFYPAPGGFRGAFDPDALDSGARQRRPPGRAGGGHRRTYLPLLRSRGSSGSKRQGLRGTALVLDPGMGFFLGPTPETSFEVLARLGEIKSRFGLPLLVSVSRKSFLRALTGRAPGKRGRQASRPSCLRQSAGRTTSAPTSRGRSPMRLPSTRP